MKCPVESYEEKGRKNLSKVVRKLKSQKELMKIPNWEENSESPAKAIHSAMRRSSAILTSKDRWNIHHNKNSKETSAREIDGSQRSKPGSSSLSKNLKLKENWNVKSSQIFKKEKDLVVPMLNWDTEELQSCFSTIGSKKRNIKESIKTKNTVSK
jgi:hypothetical protein